MKAGIEVYASDETQEHLEIVTGEYVRSLMPNKAYKIGDFIVQPFELIHSVPCLGFYIKHPYIGRLVFITDTEYSPKSFGHLGVNHLLIEANYCNEIMDRYKANSDHVLTGHMEIETTLEAIRKNKNPFLTNVILLHLSEDNADEQSFLARAQEVVGCDCYIAKKGLEVDLSLIPFM